MFAFPFYPIFTWLQRHQLATLLRVCVAELQVNDGDHHPVIRYRRPDPVQVQTGPSLCWLRDLPGFEAAGGRPPGRAPTAERSRRPTGRSGGRG
jgi:hypothetical protein